MLASAYQYGSYGLPIDGTKVEYWLRQALARDVTGAVKLRLVDLYLDGRLVRKDLDAAQQLCAAMVQSRQGLMCMARVAEYREPPDEKTATEWYKKAAEAGDVRGIIQYGTALAQGRGVKQDYAKAYYWLSIASKASTFTDFKKTLDEVTAQLSPKEIAKQDKAVERLHIRPPVQKAAATKP
jgi:TPR repeat protein